MEDRLTKQDRWALFFVLLAALFFAWAAYETNEVTKKYDQKQETPGGDPGLEHEH